MPLYKPEPFRIAMIPTSNSGVAYYRMAAWAKEMRKYKGVEVALFRFKYDMIEPNPWQREITFDPEIRREIESLCKIADVVVWQGIHYDHTLSLFREMKSKYGKTTVVETDDNYVDLPHWNEAFRSFAPGSPYRRNAVDCMREADAVIVSTPHLRDSYEKFNGNIHIIENSIDFIGNSSFVGWDSVSMPKHKGVRIGWIGGRTHFDDLWMVAPVLREVLEKMPGTELVLVNSAFKQSCDALKKAYPFSGLNVKEADRSVAINRYAKFAGSFGFDIGIAPLVDCAFNRSKSNLRWLEYSALGIPSVCSHVGHFSQTVRNGTDGLLSRTLEDWKQQLLALLQLPQLRENIGRSAKARVRKDFNVRRNAAFYIRLLKQIARKPISEEDVWISQRSNPILANS